MSAARSGKGALAIVLHTHMPYVEGFGTWPFGEEWLWEALVGCYLPLLDLLDRGAPLTVSLTPVLCDQLEAPGLAERFVAFVEGVRRDTHAEDAAGMRAAGHDELAAELERSWTDYTAALEALDRRGGDLVGDFAAHAGWTSAATHAVLPMLVTDAGVRAQVRTGAAAHRRRFGEWGGGFWLPECAYAPWLGPLLEREGVSRTCVELTSRFGLGAREHLRPLVDDSGLVLVPIDRRTISLVWSDGGYPAAGAYRDYHHHTVHHHTPWSNDGNAYDRDRALARARADAADFVARTASRMREAGGEGSPLPGGGVVVCALDTELLGHWWYEGVAWLEAVVEECSRQELALVRLEDASAMADPAAVSTAGWEESSWGLGGGLSTWSAPPVAEMAWLARRAELDVLVAGERAGAAALRELLALQASDWAFMVSREVAVPYARERFAGHRERLQAALGSSASGAAAEALRNLAPHADPAVLREP